MTSSLAKKAVKGVFWSLTQRFGIQFLQFFIGISLARLLTPSDYGLIGMIVVFFQLAAIFIESGFGHAYVQKNEATNVDANTIFYFNLMVGFAFYLLLWLCAPAISRFYDQPMLIALTRAMGVIVIINSFGIIQMASLKRELDFKKRSVISLVAISFSGIAGIAAACRGFGVWSLVIQRIVNVLIRTLGLWAVSNWRPMFVFSFESLRNLFSFGGWLFLSGLVRTFFDNLYILWIGKFFSAAELGFYTKAKSFQRLSTENIALSFNEVSFSVFSRLQEDKEKLKKGIKLFLQHSMLVVVPVSGILFVVAESFVVLLLTEKWSPMVPYLKILCLISLLYPIQLVNIQSLVAQGKSSLNFKITMVKNLLRIVNLAVTYRFGVIYIVYGELVVSIISVAVNCYFTKILLSYGFMQQIWDIRRRFFDFALIVIIGLAIHNVSDNILINFIGSGIFCSGAYLLSHIFLWKTEFSLIRKYL